MNTLIVNLCIVFVVMVVVLAFKKPLNWAVCIATIVAVLLYSIPITEVLEIAFNTLTSTDTLIVVGSFYLVTVLQRMLVRKNRIKEAEVSLSGIFNSRRISASVAPSIVGLLPSVGAMPLCAEIIKSTCGDTFDKDDLACITSFYRHIPESFFPAFSNILIALTMSGVSASSFVIGMLPLVAVLYVVGYFFYLRKVPRVEEKTSMEEKKIFFKQFFRSIWTVIALIIAIVALNLPVYVATPLVFVINFFVDRFKVSEIPSILIDAFETHLIVNTVLLLFFSAVITHTGVIYELPDFFGQFPISMPLIFALIFFFGTLVSGGTAIVTLCMPMALLAIPDAGVMLVVFLLALSYAAMQFSPTHICLFIAAGCYDSSYGAIVRRNVKLIVPYLIATFAYAAACGIFS